jgi:hypothetical protein
MSKSKNDIAWEVLFDTHSILDRVSTNGFCEISGVSIGKERDPGLMTSFDHRIQLPSIFKQHQLSIIPKSRSSYVIGHFASYFDLPTRTLPALEEIRFPATLETINPQDLYSEPAALMCAHKAGILEYVLNESVVLTVTGTMSAGRFSYSIDDLNRSNSLAIEVENPQCYVAGGFEGATTFAIVEVTNETVDDFLIRVLFYPYRLWCRKTRKEVIPIYLSYSNDVFSLYRFRFSDPLHHNSIEIDGQWRFQIESNEIELADIVSILTRIEVVDEPQDVPFPQADNFQRVVDLLNQLNTAGTLSQEDITTNYAFDLRQTQYYTTAGTFLNLIERKHSREEGVMYALTQIGSSIMSQRPAQRNLALTEILLGHRVFFETVSLYLAQAERPTTDQVVEIMRAANIELDRDGNTTMNRRAQTVLAWVDWMMGLTRT